MPPLRATYGQGERAWQVIDVKTTFLYGDIVDKVYIELPPEDERHGKGYVGILRKAMYGTRGAPQVWQTVVKRVMKRLGFEMNVIHPCIFYHRKRDMMVVTHVDDFLCSGDRKDLQWLTKELKKEFVIKGERIGDRPGDVEVSQFLGRTIRRTSSGYEYEGNEKLARILCKE